MGSRPREHQFIGGISGLRALAVLSVTLFHINAAWLPGGFVGVDVFFVISGFVVAHSVFGVRKASFSEYFLWFYRRRFLRILPAIFLYVLVIATLGVLFLPTSEVTKYIEVTGVSALFGASNFALLWKAGDYFAATSEYNTFTHTWSLAVEEQYYVLFPFFSYFMIIRQNVSERARTIMIVLAWAACLLSLVLAAWFTAHAREFAFYMLPTRLWELGIGFMLRYQGGALVGRFDGRKAGATLVSILAFAVLVGSFLWTPADGFPFPGALLPCFATLALVGVVWLAPGGPIDRLLQTAPLRFFGDLSYSLYLWHWGVVVMMRWTVGLDTVGLQLFAIALMIVLALASYHLVEKPLRYDRRLAALGTPQFFGAYAVAGALIAVASLGLLHEKPRVGFAASNDEAVWSPYMTPPGAPGSCPVKVETNAFQGGWRLDMTPSCGARSDRSIFVIGDSHAGAYERMMNRVASQERQVVHLYTMGSCHVLPIASADELPGCPKFRKAAEAEVLAKARPSDILFLPALYTPIYRKLWDAEISPDAGLTPDRRTVSSAAVARSVEALRQFSDRDLAIILEAPKPALPTALFRCADWFNRGNDYCLPGWSVPLPVMEARRKAPLDALRQVADAVPGTRLWDPLPKLCPEGRCDGYFDGKPLYYDTHHLSGYGNEVLLPSFRAMLDKVEMSSTPSPSKG